MIELDQRLREELDRITGPVPHPDWDAVLAQAATASRPVRRRHAPLVLLVAVAVAVLCVATPLGAAIASGIGGFSSWLTGEPGTPAPKSAQQAFARANARSWLGFPAGTKLRQLTSVKAAGKTVELLGFRAGGTLCLRVLVSGVARSRRRRAHRGRRFAKPAPRFASSLSTSASAREQRAPGTASTISRRPCSR